MNYIVCYTSSALLVRLWTPTCGRWAYFRMFCASVDYRELL